MLLAVDAGNTNIVFAVFEGEKIVDQWRISTSSTRTAEEYFVWISSLMNVGGIAAKGINGAIIASVVPQALTNLRALCVRYFEVEPFVIGENDLAVGIKIRVNNPEEVGADRLVNGVAAHARYDGALIVIDFGTATTFDIIDDDGSYWGGVIAPGVNNSLQALHQAAAKLPLIAIRKPRRVIGQSTTDAMQSGIYWGYVGLIEGLVGKIKAEFGRDMTVVATGGLARLFSETTPVIQHVDQDLTIRGLQLIYSRQVK